MKLLLAAAALAALCVASASQAATLLDVTNLDGSYSEVLSFVATNTTTTLDVAGYNLPSFIDVSQNSVTTGGGSNLLGASWNFTAAPVGSDAFTFSDGSGVDALAFGAVVVGSYDDFSQSIATTVGATYTYSFQYDNSYDPSGLRVSVDAGGVPEPATWGLMLVGFGLAGASMRARRKAFAA